MHVQVYVQAPKAKFEKRFRFKRVDGFLLLLHRQVMGLGPRRVVDNQGKVRSGSAYFPFTVPLAAGALNHAGMDCRRAASSPRKPSAPMSVCMGWISTWERFMHRHRAPNRRPRRRCAVVNLYLLAPLERRIYPVVSPGAIATRRDVPCTQVNPVSGLSTSLEEILRKELLQTLDSVDTGQAGPSPSAPKASHGEHSDTTAWRS